MKYLLLIFLLVGCSPLSHEEIIKGRLKTHSRKVMVDGIECIVISEYSDGSGATGISCNWK